MSFERPLALLALLLVPAAVAAYVLFQRRRTSFASRFTNPALLPNLVPESPGWRRHLPPAVLCLALAALLVGAAGPQAVASVRREEATIVLAVDVSRSMAARDVEPTRLAAAQAAARTFVDEVPKQYRLGVVTFADAAVVVVPATVDRRAVREAIDGLRLGAGTALGDAIGRAIDVGRGLPQGGSGTRARARRPDEPPASILVLSDGAQTQGKLRPLQAAQRAKSLEIPVYTVSLGTPAGVVEVPRPGGYRERITVPPDPETLKRVASVSGGTSYTAPDAKELKAVYEELASRLGKVREPREISYAFAAGGALLLLAGGTLSALWFGRLP